MSLFKMHSACVVKLYHVCKLNIYVLYTGFGLVLVRRITKSLNIYLLFTKSLQRIIHLLKLAADVTNSVSHKVDEKKKSLSRVCFDVFCVAAFQESGIVHASFN